MRRVLVASIVVALAAGCGSSEPQAEPIASDRSTDVPAASRAAPPAVELVAPVEPPGEHTAAALAAGPAEPACVPGEERPARTDGRALAAVVQEQAPAFGEPDGKQLAVFEKRNQNDVPTVFGVLASVLDERCHAAWYRVQLPMRPNGATGYVRASDVEVASVSTRIVVDLSERRLSFYRDGERVMRAPVAVGASITPTPKGSYYVNQRLVAPDPWGPFGPAALGISAFSPVLQEWSQGGPIAIHGTNDPGSIGQAVSHGCIRVTNETIEFLFRETLAGTPVEIRA